MLLVCPGCLLCYQFHWWVRTFYPATSKIFCMLPLVSPEAMANLSSILALLHARMSLFLLLLSHFYNFANSTCTFVPVFFMFLCFRISPFVSGTIYQLVAVLCSHPPTASVGAAIILQFGCHSVRLCFLAPNLRPRICLVHWTDCFVSITAVLI